MAAPFFCNVCNNPILPDSTGLVSFSSTEAAATVHKSCRRGLGSRTPIDRLRHGPIGVVADCLQSPDGRPWVQSLPLSIRGLIKELFRVEGETAKEGK